MGIKFWNKKEEYKEPEGLKHEVYMEIKLIISVWNAKLEKGENLEWLEEMAFKNLFKMMNSRQQWDTVDGNHGISKFLKEKGIVDDKYKFIPNNSMY